MCARCGTIRPGGIPRGSDWASQGDASRCDPNGSDFWEFSLFYHPLATGTMPSKYECQLAALRL
jgi:hypothetical protein